MRAGSISRSTAIAATFLPPWANRLFRHVFWFCLAHGVLDYAAVFLPETKGKTLEEIEAHSREQRNCSFILIYARRPV